MTGHLFPESFEHDDAFTFDVPAKFGGPDVTAADEVRLERLLDRVREHMSDGAWRTLREIQAACGGSEASVSARLRDLRKAPNGGLTVERQRMTPGTWSYRVAS